MSNVGHFRKNTPHTVVRVREWLTSKFGERVISRFTERPRPAKSAELSPMHYWFLSVCLVELMKNPPNSISELVNTVERYTCGEYFHHKNWHSRIPPQRCICGSHIYHLLSRGMSGSLISHSHDRSTTLRWMTLQSSLGQQQQQQDWHTHSPHSRAIYLLPTNNLLCSLHQLHRRRAPMS